MTLDVRSLPARQMSWKSKVAQLQLPAHPERPTQRRNLFVKRRTKAAEPTALQETRRLAVGRASVALGCQEEQSQENQGNRLGDGARDGTAMVKDSSRRGVDKVDKVRSSQ